MWFLIPSTVGSNGEKPRYFKGSLEVEGTGRARRTAAGLEIEVVEGRFTVWSEVGILTAANMPALFRIESARRGEGLEP